MLDGVSYSVATSPKRNVAELAYELSKTKSALAKALHERNHAAGSSPVHLFSPTRCFFHKEQRDSKCVRAGKNEFLLELDHRRCFAERQATQAEREVADLRRSCPASLTERLNSATRHKNCEDDLGAALSRASAAEEDLRKVQAERDRYKAKSSELEEKCTAAQLQCSQLKHELSVISGELSFLQHTVDLQAQQAATLREKTAAAVTERDRLLQDLEQCERVCSKIQTSFDKLFLKYETRNALQSVEPKKVSSNEAAEQELFKLQATLEEAESKLICKTQALNASKTKVKNLEDALLEQELAFERLRKDCETSQFNRAESLRLLAANEERYNKLSDEYDVVVKSMEAEKGAHKKTEERLSEALQEKEYLLKKGQEAMGRENELLSKCSRLEGLLGSRNAEFSLLENTLENVRKEMVALKNENHSLFEQVNGAMEEKDDLKNRLSEMETSMRTVQQDFLICQANLSAAKRPDDKEVLVKKAKAWKREAHRNAEIIRDLEETHSHRQLRGLEVIRSLEAELKKTSSVVTELQLHAAELEAKNRVLADAVKDGADYACRAREVQETVSHLVGLRRRNIQSLLDTTKGSTYSLDDSHSARSEWTLPSCMTD